MIAQAKVSRYSGGVECLVAAGFRPQRDDNNAVIYVIEEPEFEKDHEAWTTWYDAIKEVRDKLLEESNNAKKAR
jgi:cell division protein FtsI/penicillin-binding protein 2